MTVFTLMIKIHAALLSVRDFFQKQLLSCIILKIVFGWIFYTVEIRSWLKTMRFSKTSQISLFGISSFTVYTKLAAHKIINTIYKPHSRNSQEKDVSEALKAFYEPPLLLSCSHSGNRREIRWMAAQVWEIDISQIGFFQDLLSHKLLNLNILYGLF